MLHSRPCTLNCTGPSLSTNSVILGKSLCIRGKDHIENTLYYCRDVLPRNCLAKSQSAYYDRVFTALLPNNAHGADHTENTAVTVAWLLECVYWVTSMLISHLCLDISSSRIASDFPTKILFTFLVLSMWLHAYPQHLHRFSLHLKNIVHLPLDTSNDLRMLLWYQVH
jgi:hypothetical protein